MEGTGRIFNLLDLVQLAEFFEFEHIPRLAELHTLSDELLSTTELRFRGWAWHMQKLVKLVGTSRTHFSRHSRICAGEFYNIN